MIKRLARALSRAALWWPLPGLALIAAVGLLLRISLIGLNRFHYDEALYSYWGLLIATGRDPWLSNVTLDKPPLFFYILALSFKLFGPGEIAARLPNIVASLAGIALLYKIAQDLYDRRVATLSALLLALSPFDIQYAPTAFTDPTMVSLALAACLLALKGRPAGAGLLVGLAVMTKQTAMFFLPLVVFLAAAGPARARASPTPRSLATLGAGAGAMVGAGFLWDVLARPLATDFWSAGVARYGGLKFMPWSTIAGRLQAWAGMMQYLTGSWPLNLTLVLGVPALLACGLLRRRERPGWRYDWALAAFALAFIAGHTLLSFSLWDRYLLGLAPVAALLLARVLVLPYDLLLQRQGPGRRAAYGWALAVLVGAAVCAPVGTALKYGFPIGGDHGAFQGIEQVGHYLRTARPGTIVFQQFLDWHLSFYAFDAPVQLQYYSTYDYVLDLSQRARDRDKYAIIPSWVKADGLEAFLRGYGWRMSESYRAYRDDGAVSFTLYKLEPPS